MRLVLGVILFGGTALIALHDWAGIGTADDHQSQDDNRRERRLAELRFALDRVLGRAG